MRLAGIILATAATVGMLGSAAPAQQDTTGMITKIDRLSGTIAIQQTQNGTVGANTGQPAVEFRVQDGKLLDAVHAGDRVTFSVAESSGIKTITKLEKQR